MLNEEPWSDHHDVLLGLEMQQLEKDVVSASDDNSCIFFHIGGELFVENARLDLIRNQQE